MICSSVRSQKIAIGAENFENSRLSIAGSLRLVGGGSAVQVITTSTTMKEE